MTFYEKPSGFTQTMNGVMRWLASKGIGPKKMVTLEVKGRRSGEVRSTVVNVVEHEGQRYLVAPRGETEWVRNVRASGGEAVLVRGGRKTVRLEEVPLEQRAPICKTYLGENAMATKQHFGIEPTAELSEYEGIASKHPVFRVVEGTGG